LFNEDVRNNYIEMGSAALEELNSISTKIDYEN